MVENIHKASPSYYIERGVSVPFFNENTIGKDFLPVSCVHGAGASRKLVEPVHKILRASDPNISACLYDGGMDRITAAKGKDMIEERALKKAELDLLVRHFNEGGAFVCVKDKMAFGSVIGRPEDWLEELLIENLKAFEMYSSEYKISSIWPDAKPEVIVGELKKMGVIK